MSYKNSLSPLAIDAVVQYMPNSSWKTMQTIGVQKIVENKNSMPSMAFCYTTDTRWNANYHVAFGYPMRIIDSYNNVIFFGFFTGYEPSFSGGNVEDAGSENIVFVIKDHIWLVNKCLSVTGQIGRSLDDYTSYGTESVAPKSDCYTTFHGRRCIFNRNNKPDMDPDELSGTTSYTIPMFGNNATGEFWTVRHMLKYLLSSFFLKYIEEYFVLGNPEELPGLDDDDFDTILYNVSVDGLPLFDAVQSIVTQIGWSFRITYASDGDYNLVFYKRPSSRFDYRSDFGGCVSHKLYAPAVGQSIKPVVQRGNKMVQTAKLNANIDSVVNKPYIQGGLQRFEITVPLVPGWKDDDFTVPTENPVMTDADLSESEDPDSYDFYKYYHIRGSEFKKNVGRFWVLNETGKYTGGDYDRGQPFDFSEHLPEKYISDSDGYDRWGLFERPLLPCISYKKGVANAQNYKVEFSFDLGTTWQVIPCSIQCLEDQAGIWIAEPNLTSIKDQNNGTIAEGTLADTDISLWSNLCDDMLAGRVWKDVEGSDPANTRIRITASVQMDQRVYSIATKTSLSGSPFDQIHIYDYADKLEFEYVSDSSLYYDESKLIQTDPQDKADAMANKIRDLQQDRTLAGIFVLDRLWLTNNNGYPEFTPGDIIRHIDGRDYSLATSIGSNKVYPEIVQVIHMMQQQKTKLITGDLRYSEERE